MPTLGATTKPSSSWHAFSSSSETNQEAEELTIPTAIRVLELGQWVGGWSGTCRVSLSIWDATGSRPLLGRTATITAANEGAGGPSGGNVALYTGELLTPVELSAGDRVLVGFSRHPSDGHQVSLGSSTSGPHYHGRYGGSTWDADDPFADAGGSYEESDRRIGAYIADYEELATAYVRRSGVWVRADSVQVRRSGAWVNATAVQLRRSGAWEDAT